MPEETVVISAEDAAARRLSRAAADFLSRFRPKDFHGARDFDAQFWDLIMKTHDAARQPFLQALSENYTRQLSPPFKIT